MIAETPEPEPPKIPAIEVGEVQPGKARILSFKNLSFHISGDNQRTLQ